MTVTVKPLPRKLLTLTAGLLLMLVVATCSAGVPSTVSSKWSVQPDKDGRFYGGNPTATLVIEEWSDLQ